MTPRLTRHALERCVEMGISSKVAKRIVRNAELRYPSKEGVPGAVIAQWSGDPDHAVAYVECPDGRTSVLTVLLRTPEDYVRAGRVR